MTPYTIRERRANINKIDFPEAYPGQRERALEALIAHDAKLAETERERAAEALHGGRYITHALAKTLLQYDGPRARFAGEDGPEKLSEIWRMTASPSGGEWPGSGRDTTARYAQGQAACGGVEWAHRAYWLAPALPESAFDWPIYQTAFVALVEASAFVTLVRSAR